MVATTSRDHKKRRCLAPGDSGSPQCCTVRRIPCSFYPEPCTLTDGCSLSSLKLQISQRAAIIFSAIRWRGLSSRTAVDPGRVAATSNSGCSPSHVVRFPVRLCGTLAQRPSKPSVISVLYHECRFIYRSSCKVRDRE